MNNIDKNRLFYKKFVFIENSTIRVPVGEVWEVIAYFRDHNIRNVEAFQKALFYYDHFCKNSYYPGAKTKPDFNDMFQPPFNFIDKRIPYMLSENEYFECFSPEGFFVILQYEILPLGTDREAEYWKRIA